MVFFWMVFLALTPGSFLSTQTEPEQLTISGYMETDGATYEYGSTADSEEADGYLKIITENRELLILFDEGGKEEVVFVADLGNNRVGVVVQCYVYDQDLGSYNRKKSMVVLVDVSGNIIISASVTRQIKGIGNYDHLLVLETPYKVEYYDFEFAKQDFVPPQTEQLGVFAFAFQGQAYVGGEVVQEILLTYPGNYDIEIHGFDHELSFSIVLHPAVEGFTDGASYYEAVTIVSQGELYLNGNQFASGDTVESPGLYELTVNGFGEYACVKSFTIDAVIENVYEGMTASNPVRIIANGLHQELNGETYDGKEIHEAGVYVFSVYGEGGYHKSCLFTILPIVEGIADGGSYPGGANISLNCEAKLNGVNVSRNFLVEEPGEYELICYLDEEPYLVYNFSVSHIENDDQIIINSNILIYVFAVIALVGIALIFKKR